MNSFQNIISRIIKKLIRHMKENIFILVKKIGLAIKSLVLVGFYKVRYGKNCKITSINSFKGLFSIILTENSRIDIGKFLMSAGPTYLKCIEDGHMIIGNSVFFNHNCSVTCAKRIVIGDDCNIANNVVIVDHNHNLDENGVCEGFSAKEVHIGKNVWIGANSVILSGVDIGEGAVIAAGSIVNKGVPPREIWGGIPAKKIRSL